MTPEAQQAALTQWLRANLQLSPQARVEGLQTLDFGHSAEMIALTMIDGEEQRQDLVIKLHPPSPGLLEPYDLERQYKILQALDPSPVKAPKVRCYEATGTVLGRDFYVMDRIAGEAYEREVPEELDEPGRITAMCESLVDELASVHLVDLASVGLADLDDGATYVDRELQRWAGEMQRVQRGPLPALERLHAELTSRRPAPSGRITLVHGDAKPGNFGFVDDRASAVFDWEMTDLGDPLADIGYLEMMWAYPVGITSRPTAPPFEHVLARWEERTGIQATDRAWWLALAAFKTSVILLVGSMLFDAGISSDMRYLEMALGVDMTTQAGLQALGVTETIEAGPVISSDERIAEIMAAATHQND